MIIHIQAKGAVCHETLPVVQYRETKCLCQCGGIIGVKAAREESRRL